MVENAHRRAEIRKTLDFWKPAGVFVEYGAVRGFDFSVFGDIPREVGFTMCGGAKIYSFWTSDATGRSGGYLGCGSLLS